MATGIMQRFKGKVMAAVLYIGAGGIVDPATGIGGKPQVIARQVITVTATANTDFAVPIPAGASVLSVQTYTDTAFTGTTVTLQAGSTVGGVDYIAAATIKAAGTVFHTLVAAAQQLGNFPAATNFNIRIVQTGPTNVGHATVVIEYALP